MLTSIPKVILLPVLTLGAGFFFALYEKNAGLENIHTEYPEHLTGTFTGGFGEQTCHSCHFDYDLNWNEGKLIVEGIPGKLSRGETYQIKVIVRREKLGKAGFQLTARFKNGVQAGSFLISDNQRVIRTEKVPDSLQYIQHSVNGTEPQSKRESYWVIQWIAPEVITDSVVVNISANAANGDQSEFGDWIYNREITVK
jgi:hypothetical protein